MLKTLFSFFVLFFSLQHSAQSRKFYKAGTATLPNPVEALPFTYQNDLPLVEVTFGGKKHIFLLDTGAPTIISPSTYKELGLKSVSEANVNDSQNAAKKQIFTKITEIKIGNVTFNNIGAIVMEFNQPEFTCRKIDGIFGANQMAHLFWKINYAEGKMLVSKNIRLLTQSEFPIKIPFQSTKQKTPIISSQFLDKKVNLTFDTGFNGYFKIDNSIADVESNIAKENYITTVGSNSVSMYGAAKIEQEYLFMMNNLSLAKENFKNQIIDTGISNLLGNKFLKNYEYILDWKKNLVYLKPLVKEADKSESFGFGYRFIKNKAFVALIFKEKNIPLQLNDEILEINGISLENLNESKACNYYLNRIEKDLYKITVKIKRGNEIHNFTLDKFNYLL